MPNTSPISSVNDFVVRFANVNGSGSASANELFARSVLRMGIPVAPRNIFPSNIQGLPTWYEVRISESGHLGARGGTDLMVAMNPQTWEKDVASIEPEVPREAQQAGTTEGKVRARMTVAGSGEVTRVEIVEATPRRVFDRAVVRALSQWKYPSGDAGRTVDVDFQFRSR